MEFRFDEEHETVRALAREILEKEVDAERVRAAETSADWTDAALWSRLAEANLLGVALPESAGGMGMGFTALCVLLGEIGRQVVPGPAFATLVLGALPVAALGSEAQRAEWLPKVVAGEVVLTGVLPEGGIPTVHARSDDDGATLDGTAAGVPFAGRAARMVLPVSGPDGPALRLADPGASGVDRIPQVTSTGEPLFDLSLSGVHSADGDRLGPAGPDAAAALEALRDRALVALAALQVGVCERALEITTAYAREREQFGVPIGSFQAVQHRCADAFIDLEAMRWTLWRAAWRLEQGLPAHREAAVAKFWAAEGGARIAGAALHLHGGLGSDVDYPIHRHFLWSKALELRLGGATAQLVRLGRDMARTGPREAA